MAEPRASSRLQSLLKASSAPPNLIRNKSKSLLHFQSAVQGRGRSAVTPVRPQRTPDQWLALKESQQPLCLLGLSFSPVKREC